MSDDIGYISGYIYNKNRIVVVASSAKLEEQNVRHAFICAWKNGAWDYWDEDYSVIKVCVYDGPAGVTLIEMGVDGEISVADVNGFRPEALDSPPEAPSRLRPLSDLRRIGDFLFVTGMRRQVFRRRLFQPNWERCDAGVLLPRKSKEIAGFLSIDGFDDTEVYAVGYGGEIWIFDGAVWSRIASPTNLRLEAIRCTGPGDAVAVGDQGIILRGRADRWDVIQQSICGETFTDVEILGDTAYIATDLGALYKLDSSGLSQVEFALEKEVTTGDLHCDGKHLLSVGDGDLLLFDGSTWNEMPHPVLPAN